MPAMITLCSDFGLQDGYVAAMKGVILSILPDATLVDISHEIEPQAIAQGAFVLESTCRFFPAGTVHLAVVDPGVGTARRPIAVRTARCTYIAPDNGLLALVLREEPALQAVTLSNPAYRRPDVSHTFHGRDIFAPAAAHLAAGVPLAAFGEDAGALVPLPLPEPQVRADGAIEGHILHIDRFGNLVSDIPATLLAGRLDFYVRVNGLTVHGLSATYADVPVGAALALIGSHGRLEIAVRNGSARERSGAALGAGVIVY